MSNQLTVSEQLANDLPDLAKVISSEIKPETFLAVAANAMAQSPDLANAEPNSIIVSLTQCAKDGLMPDGKEAALVVFNKKIKTPQGDQWVPHAQYMPMIDGVLKRARLSGQVASIAAKVVCSNDEFNYWVDEDGEHFKHVPNFADRGELTLVYAFAKMNNGELAIEVMSKVEVDQVRAASKTGTYGPWKDWYERMATKSVLHRLSRRLPNASELTQLMEINQPMNWEKEPAQSQERVINEPGTAESIGYSEDDFNKHFPKWEKAILAGKLTAQDVIDRASSKAELSQEQQMNILGVSA